MVEMILEISKDIAKIIEPRMKKYLLWQKMRLVILSMMTILHLG